MSKIISMYSVKRVFALPSFPVTMWRASWEKRSVRSQSWSEWSPGNLPSGSAWRKSACEAVSASSQRYPSSGLSWLQGSAH